ncbi:MAG: DUF2188 domain-containing protein [Sandarakinorhabdus sp.]|nr:DUF2188 domain-containing protein [Sandarakinorhabdus sp.]
MAREQYVVIRENAEWRISFSGNLYGRYAEKAEAVRIAIETAAKAGAAGLEAEVLVEGDDGMCRTAWTHGTDAPPPAVG